MNDKEMITQENEIDLKTLITGLIDSYPSENRKAVLGIAKAVNAKNREMSSRDLKKMFSALAKNWKKTKHKKLNSDPSKPIRISQLMRLQGISKWIIKDLLPGDGITILSGDPGSFKTWSTLHFAICIAEGSPVYGHFETLKSNVLIIDEEDGPALLQKRAKILSADHKANIYFMVMSGFKVDNEVRMQKLKQYIKKHRISVVIIDSLIRIHEGEENSAKDIAKVFNELRTLNTQGVTVLLNHHHRKKPMGRSYDSQPMRGSGDILAAIDCQMQISHKDDKLLITQTKNRHGEELKTFSVDIVKDGDKLSLVYSGEQEITAHNKSQEAKGQILEVLAAQEDWMSRADIEEALDGTVGENKIGLALTDLVERAEVEHKVMSKGKKMYRVLQE